MEKLKFYNVKTKNRFSTDKYTLESKQTSKGTKYFAVTRNGGIDVYRVVSEQFYLMNR